MNVSLRNVFVINYLSFYSRQVIVVQRNVKIEKNSFSLAEGLQ
ncbi:hypothetical protein SAMN05444285_1147 [Draconibacterium orientale]|uniref:Uncharacterized protein n=1 Tax=Draconibacterium orientale TaxID=1168034 RepID=A0A1I0EPR3_9BACT|nr:hypothetical protein SAMN05444285_1147 [Draconibacterium orientale]